MVDVEEVLEAEGTFGGVTQVVAGDQLQDVARGIGEVDRPASDAPEMELVAPVGMNEQRRALGEPRLPGLELVGGDGPGDVVVGRVVARRRIEAEPGAAGLNLKRRSVA